jgi:hypothetical protein
VIPVLVQVDRQVQRFDQFFFDLPRFVADLPDDSGVVSQPFRQAIFASAKRHAMAASDSPQLESQFIR